MSELSRSVGLLPAPGPGPATSACSNPAMKCRRLRVSGGSRRRSSRATGPSSDLVQASVAGSRSRVCMSSAPGSRLGTWSIPGSSQRTSPWTRTVGCTRVEVRKRGTSPFPAPAPGDRQVVVQSAKLGGSFAVWDAVAGGIVVEVEVPASYPIVFTSALSSSGTLWAASADTLFEFDPASWAVRFSARLRQEPTGSFVGWVSVAEEGETVLIGWNRRHPAGTGTRLPVPGRSWRSGPAATPSNVSPACRLGPPTRSSAAATVT